MRLNSFIALLVFVGGCLAQSPERLKIVPLPQNDVKPELLAKLKNVELGVMELADSGNKKGEYAKNYGMVKEILRGPYQSISDDELLELRKAMHVSVCNFGIFEYYFANCIFVQGKPTAVFMKTQGHDGVNGFVFRGDEKTLYVVSTTGNGDDGTPVDYGAVASDDITEVRVLRKLSRDLYAIISPSNGTCSEITILR